MLWQFIPVKSQARKAEPNLSASVRSILTIHKQVLFGSVTVG